MVWRAALAINHLVNKPYEIRGFRLDSDFFPVSAAGGGKGDLYCEFDKFMILTEVTMSTSSRQEAMEGEPVRRHVSDAVQKYNKPVYGMFIAVKIDTNTAETFRHGVWYTKDNQQQRLNIVPLTLDQFQKYFEWMFITNQASPEQLVELLDDCVRKRDQVIAPIWQKYILDRVLAYAKMINGKDSKSVNKFPDGIFFGTKIYDAVKERVGCVVGRSQSDEYILKAELDGAARIWFVMTCGSEIGNAANYNRQLAEKKHLQYMGTKQIVMPENYIAMFGAPEDAEAREIVKRAEPDIAEAIRCVKEGQCFPAPRNNLYGRVMSAAVNPIFYPIFAKANAFQTSKACTGCGECVRRCPMKNIELKGGKPVWGANCTHCMACICYCPAEAIEYGKKSVGKPRYHFERLGICETTK